MNCLKSSPRRAVMLGALTLAFAVGCSDDDPAPDGNDAFTVRSADGSATLTIPAGGLPPGAAMSDIQLVRDDSLISGLEAPWTASVWALAPHGTVLSAPAQIELAVAAAPGAFVFGLHNGDAGLEFLAENEEDLQFDETTGAVTHLRSNISHFSSVATFSSGLLADDPDANLVVEFAPPPHDSTVQGEVSLGIRAQSPNATIFNLGFAWNRNKWDPESLPDEIAINVVEGSAEARRKITASPPLTPTDVDEDSAMQMPAQTYPHNFTCEAIGPYTLVATIRVQHRILVGHQHTGATIIGAYMRATATLPAEVHQCLGFPSDGGRPDGGSTDGGGDPVSGDPIAGDPGGNGGDAIPVVPEDINALAWDPLSQFLFMADTNPGRILSFNPANGTFVEVSGPSVGLGDLLGSPIGIGVLDADTLVVATEDDNRFYRVDKSSGDRTAIPQSGGAPVELDNVKDLVVHPITGSIYLLVQPFGANGSIWVLDATAGTLTEVTGDGAGSGENLNFAAGIALDPDSETLCTCDAAYQLVCTSTTPGGARNLLVGTGEAPTECSALTSRTDSTGTNDWLSVDRSADKVRLHDGTSGDISEVSNTTLCPSQASGRAIAYDATGSVIYIGDTASNGIIVMQTDGSCTLHTGM